MKNLKSFYILMFGIMLILPLRSNAQNISAVLSSVEASGITRFGDHLIFVTDNQPGAYFKFGPVTAGATEMLLEGERLSLVKLPGADLAYDLEEIDILADGRIVVLSERLRMLIGESGVIAHYEDALSEVGGKGLEGLAIKQGQDSSSNVAVLWEGGYLEYDNIPHQFTKSFGEKDLRKSYYPLIFLHDIKFNESSQKKIDMKKNVKLISLQTPRDSLEPGAQRFRAPDLVWYKLNSTDWGFIVLLNSENSVLKGSKFLYSRLQKYNLDGQPIGSPVDLKQKVPTHLKDANWEGLAWFEDQKSLVLVHDKRPLMGTPTAVILKLDDLWPTIKEVKK